MAPADCAIITKKATLRSESMDTNTQLIQRSIEMPTDLSDPAVQMAALDDEIVRSENNILQWTAYLPEDCIRTMIEMGWDIST
jgi:hypothetical protein